MKLTNCFNPYLRFAIVAMMVLASGACFIKKEAKTPILLKTENAPQAQLMKEVNRFARVDSMHARMYFSFEDNSFAEFGSKDVYRQADAEVTVQRPSDILLKVQVPVLKSDLVQMSSDGETFRVALLKDGGTGKNRRFVKGTNNADYSKLQKRLNAADLDHAKQLKEGVNAFANIRPQHFTEAMLVRPTDPANVYTQTSIYQTEEDSTVSAKSPVRSVMRGYYLLDEYGKHEDGSLAILRRFWFDRVGGIRLARQQIFDAVGEIESDIVYGKEGSLTDTGDYANLPLEIQVTRPKDKYSIKFSYQTPAAVMIGHIFPQTAFVLQNSWNLEEVDLDKRLHEAALETPPTSNANSFTRFH
jgi:hypothetical protein